MTDYAFNENKGYCTTNSPKKKAQCIADKIFLVIDESLVKHLSIDDDTWFEQEAIEEGILFAYSSISYRINQ